MDNASSSKFHDSEDEDLEQLQYKVILLGDGSVGKTSIAMRFAEDQFSQVYKQTVGVDFFIRRLNIPPKYQIAMQLWDIGGQSIGSKMISNYIAGAHAVLLCYDVTNYESFANLEDWYRLVTRTFDKTTMPYVALIGNKNDLKHLLAVRPEQHNAFAEENGMASFLMSAKTADQVKHAFVRIASTLSGATVSKNELDVHTSVVKATIVNHQRHDEDVNNGRVPDIKVASSCSIT